MTPLEINEKLAVLLGFSVKVDNDSVFVKPTNDKEEAAHFTEFDMFDGTDRSRALCFDLIERFCVTIHPRRTLAYRYGQCGPYARCGSHEPVYNDCLVRAVCEAVVKTYGPDDEVLK